MGYSCFGLWVLKLEGININSLWWSFITFGLNNWILNFFFILSILRLFLPLPTLVSQVRTFSIFYFTFIEVTLTNASEHNLHNNPDKLFFNLVDGLTTIHPPIFYLSFILVIFLLSTRLGLGFNGFSFLFTEKFVRNSFILSIGALVTGGYWSFLQSTWNMWWTWDPIELCLLSLLCLTLLSLHHTNNNSVEYVFFYVKHLIFIFIFVVSIRLGILSSLHSFFDKKTVVTVISCFFNLFVLFLLLVYTYQFSWLGIGTNKLLLSTVNRTIGFFLSFVIMILLNTYADLVNLLTHVLHPTNKYVFFFIFVFLTQSLLISSVNKFSKNFSNKIVLHLVSYAVLLILSCYFTIWCFFYVFLVKTPLYYSITYDTESEVSGINLNGNLFIVDFFKKKHLCYKTDNFLSFKYTVNFSYPARYDLYSTKACLTNTQCQFYVDQGLIICSTVVLDTYFTILDTNFGSYFNLNNVSLSNQYHNNFVQTRFNYKFSKFVNTGVTQNYDLILSKKYLQNTTYNFSQLQRADNLTLRWYVFFWLLFLIILYF